MRIIAGTASGIRLAVPRHKVRPTMDRVKGAIFSSLGEIVVGAEVLDLFAGTGALGIEALSRGASAARFVDHDREAASMIERNLTKAKLTGRVVRRDVFDFLRRPISSDRFDIIFADPPYDEMCDDESYISRLLAHDGVVALLKPSGVFVLEKRPTEEVPETKLWRIIRAKTYGSTEVLFLKSNSSRSRQSA